MKRFGFAIRTGGDPEIAEALAGGIKAGSRQPHHSDAVRRVAMMRHTPEEWRQMTEDARVIYGGQRYRPRWAERMLVGWALICLGVSWMYHRQDRLLHRRTV